ncbi:hypothetical protein AB1Y20_005217 [Prymnesium parvum]|uniref:DUF218 domain-containing protein n=1 Tax=Prymnesium parvum TaxID=97485 RepID=A0AB34J3M1_PRYPA
MRAAATPRRRTRAASPTFLLGACSGLLCSWIYHQVMLMLLDSRPPFPPHLVVPVEPPRTGGFHAIVVPAGGQHEEGPPAHVLARLERAVQLYRMAPDPKPFVITTAWGTPHKPCPHDAAGFERHEAQDNAHWLLRHGIPPEALLEESVSLETVGNAFFTRVMHTDVRSLRRLAVINNRFHMPRTRAVFEHVFRVPPRDGEPMTNYEIEFIEVDDRLPRDALSVREEKERTALPKFLPGGPWQTTTPHLRAMHEWLYQENTAYATKRLNNERKPIDPALLKSY